MNPPWAIVAILLLILREQEAANASPNLAAALFVGALYAFYRWAGFGGFGGPIDDDD